MNKVGFFRSIQLKFIIIYILLLFLAVQVIASFFTQQLEEKLVENFTNSIEVRVELLGYNLEQAFNRERDETQPRLEQEIQQIVEDMNNDNVATNVKVINAQSKIIGTNSTVNRGEIGKRLSEPIVQQALFFETRETKTVLDEQENRVWVHVEPFFNSEEILEGVIFFQASLEDVYDQVMDINEIFLQGSILAITISAILGVLVARTITKPISEMREQALIMANGDFTKKVNVYGKDEIGQLAETFNDLNSRLKHSYSTIEEERRKLSSVLSNMTDGVIATDSNGAVTLMNEAAGRLISQNPEEVIGEFLLDVLQLEGKNIDLSELQDNGSMIIDLSEDDNPFLLRANFSSVTDDYDETTGFITVISDVTDQEKVEQERREFVSNVSHELRTPLTTMKSYIEALTEGAWEDREIAPKFLQVAQGETDRMIRMVNDLLQLSKMDAEEYPLHKERTDFVRFFHHVIDRREMDKPERIEFLRQIPKDRSLVWMDKDKMTQVLDNIITNAIKYSPDGGKITLKLEIKRLYLLVSIQDEGMGIAYDKLEKIFERFYRADKARNRKLGGTGLGLAITKELVEAHHGKIWAKSKEGKGTTILFTLPLMSKKRRDIR